ncbi:MAG: RHS repeat-associated core domain-containing protein [Candidatus Obscuribacterales bacterium]|jgi:RHS repeat-associated protein
MTKSNKKLTSQTQTTLGPKADASNKTPGAPDPTKPKFGPLPKQVNIDPDTAKRVIESRVIPGKIYVPGDQQKSIAQHSFAAGNASNTVAGPASIVELARALKNDVDLIHQWVVTNCEFLPSFGSAKSGYGALVDGLANSFDQADLMVQLLRQAGYSANYLFGELEMNATQLANWLGTDSANIWSSANLLANGGIPSAVIFGSPDKVRFSHVWVKVQIASVWYVFDPSNKSYTTTAGIDLAVATGYNATTFMNNARSGATITADYIQNMNRANVRSDMQTMATNLFNWIQTNNPGATTDQIVGGRSINDITLGQRITSLPYERAGGTITEWTAIPNAYKTVLHVMYDDPNININFYSADIYGKRLTLGFNGSHQAELRLDGTLLATSSAQGVGTWNSVLTEVFHPYGSTFADSYVWMRVWADHNYLIGNAWGNSSNEVTNIHLTKLKEGGVAGLSNSVEAMWGETFATIFHTWHYETSRSTDLVNRLTGCRTVNHHEVGLVGHYDTPLADISSVVWSTSALDNNYDRAKWNDSPLAMLGVTYESAVISQITKVGGVSTTPLMDVAIAAGQKIYDGKTANWISNVKPNLVNYPSGDLTDIENGWINYGYRVALPENGSVTLGSWVGYGFWANPGQGSFGLIQGGLKGVVGNTPQTQGETVDTTRTNNRHGTTGERGNPNGVPGGGHNQGGGYPQTPPNNGGAVSALSGTEKFDTSDLSCGSQGFPYGLEFSRSYNSDRRLEDGVLGLGWRHNWHSQVNVGSNPVASLAARSPLFACNSLVAMFVAVDLFKDLTQPFDKYITTSLLDQWLNERISSELVTLDIGSATIEFYKLANGSFVCSAVNGAVLIQNVDLTYSYTTPYGVKYNFNLAGALATIVYPGGVTITYNYTSGKLTSVTNGMGRTLTFSYTGANLTSVSDGTGRSVSFVVDASRNLTQFTNANSKSTVYEFDAPGRLTKLFLPANPASPVYTNVYDSLNRVKEQKNALNQSLFFYIAGSRSEVVDALGNKKTYVFNGAGQCVKMTNEVNLSWTTAFDGLGRPVEVTQPEGNKVVSAYNNKGQVTSITAKAKPASGLADLVSNITYNATWNRMATFQDPRGNTTTLTYDAVTGDLLNIQRPVVGGLTPQVTFTYSARGQVLTVTDETGIVTKFTYDSTTEKLNSVVRDFGVGRLNLTSSFGYTSRGEVSSQTDPRGNTTSYVYDLLSRVTQRTDSAPFNYVCNFSYTDNSKLQSVQRQSGDPTNPLQTVSYLYSLTDKLTSLTDSAGRVSALAYDGLDRLWKTTDALNRVVELSYDATSKLLTVKDPTNQIVETRTYTNNGAVASIMDARGNSIAFTFDGFDRLDKTNYPGGTFEQNTSYDANGNVLTYRTRDAKNIVMVYDVLNRLTSKTPGTDPQVSMTYDLAGRLLTRSKPVVAGDPSSGTFTNFFDMAGRYFKEQYPDTKTVVHVLDANGNITKTTYPDGSYFVDRVYDELNRLTDIKLNGAGTSAVQVQYDALSRRRRIIFENGTSTDYGVEISDEVGSIIQSFVGSNVSLTYDFDAAGQMNGEHVSDVANFMWQPPAPSTITYGTANNLNQYPTVGGTSYSYNNNGCLTGDGTWTFGYNTESMLVSAIKSGVSASFVYDPSLRQSQKVVGSVKTKYYYSGMQRLADYDGVTNTLQQRYVYGTGLDDVLIRITNAGTKSYFHQNYQGSVIAITDAAGAVVNRYTYSPFGESPSLTGTTHGYTGQRFDPEIGLYHYKYRYYNPVIGRFLQPDPIGIADGLNIYAYVKNNPLTKVDPLGLGGNSGGGGTGGGFPPGTAAVGATGQNGTSGTGTSGIDQFREAFGDLLTEADVNAGYILDGMKPGSLQYPLYQLAEAAQLVNVFKSLPAAFASLAGGWASLAKAIANISTHGNSYANMSPNSVYAIFDRTTGLMVKIGQAGVESLTAAKTRGFNQAVRDGRVPNGMTIDDFDIVEVAVMEGTQAARQLERAMLEAFNQLHGGSGGSNVNSLGLPMWNNAMH